MINRSQTFQEIEGFGGAFTDSASHVFDSMPAVLQEQLIEMYFGPTGLRYNMGRLTIGSCDFSLEYYNYDDTKGDTKLKHFNISHDEARIIPFVHRKRLRIRVTFGCLSLECACLDEKNGHMNCDLGPWTCVLKDDADIQQAWAKYFSKYLDAYKRNKINIWGVTIQNEPEAQTGNLVYEGMHFTPSTEKHLIDHLGPVMKADHPDVNVLIYDHNKDHIVEWAQTIWATQRVPNTYGVQHFIGTLVHTSKILQTHELFPKFKLLSRSYKC